MQLKISELQSTRDLLAKASLLTSNRALLGSGLITILLLVFMAWGRQFFVFATETDFLYTNYPEALRILNGENLKIEYHPPGFPTLVAASLLIFKDAMLAGMAISIISAALAALFNFKIFEMMFGRNYGIAAGASIFLSAQLFSFSILATSDIYFFALFSAIAMLALKLAQNTRNYATAFWLGILIGISLLTRSNALTLLVCVSAPCLLLTSLNLQSLKHSLIAAAIVIAGILLPNLIWYFIASSTGTPIAPGGTVENLAMTYYSTGNRISMESMDQVEGMFDSVLDVFLHDPLHILKRYIIDLLSLPSKLGGLLTFPIVFLVIPGLISLLFKSNRFFLFYVFIILGSQVALLNLKTFEPRYYFFLLPIFAVAAFECVRFISTKLDKGWVKGSFLTACVVIFCLVSLKTVREANYRIHAQDAEIFDVIQNTQLINMDEVLWVGRKKQVAYYLGSEFLQFRGAQDLNEMKTSLSAIGTNKRILFYYGSQAKSHWKGLSSLTDSEHYPSWLSPIAQGDAAQGWTLFEYKAEQ